MKTRQEKIDAIYEKIADKIPTLGCKTEVYSRDDIIISYYDKKLTFLNDENGIEVVENYEPLLIGHPVMIGDVMDYIERNFPDGIHCIECKKGEVVSDNFNDNRIFYCDNEDCEFLSKFYGNEAFCHKMELYDSYWKEKRKPIEAQSDDCIDFVFDLIY